MMSRIASDIGTGLTELPSAVASGARNAAQESLRFAIDAGNTVGGWQDSLVTTFGGAPGKDLKAPTLPEIGSKPKSVTGGLVESVSQFLTGMIGLGKLSKPIEAAAGLARASKAVKAGVEVGKAATVGAVAFDPYGPRLADIIESVPGLSNPATRYLQSDIFDTKAEGRFKNALESIGLDAALFGTLAVGIKLFKATKALNAGEITPRQYEVVAKEAEVVEAGALAPKAVETAGLEDTTTPSAASPDAPVGIEAPPAIPRDVIELGSPAPEPRDMLDLSTKPEAVPAAPAAAAPPLSPSAAITATPENTSAILRSLEADADALARYGSRSEAIDAGHVFGAGVKVPWQKLALEDGPAGDGLGAFIARLSDTFAAELDKSSGGSVLSDAKVRATVDARAKLWGEESSTIAGQLARGGEAARDMAVNLQTSFVVASKVMQDTHVLARRIHAGDLTEFGGDREAATEALRQMLSASATLYSYGRSMATGAGRTLRLMRSEHAPSPEVLAKWQSLDPDTLVEAIMKTDGDPRALRRLANPTFLDRLLDSTQFLLVNNLLWSPRTHAVNALGNTYMLLARPAERWIGGNLMRLFGSDTTISREASAQYAYLGASLHDGWRAAIEAWQRGDSILAPHQTENFRASLNAAKIDFKPHDGLPSILHNVLIVPSVKVLGTPTRLLGAMDEAIKTIAYRSKVQAKAFVEAETAGMSGPEMKDYIAKRLGDAFDESGRATDELSLREAQTATFSQELLPDTVGKTIQDGLSKHPAGRLGMPFLRTPLNALRYSVKLTPGLNLVQREYRAMIRGDMGTEAQAQAIGQMSLGALYLGLAAWAASSGRITGGGPSDPKAKAALMATGWQPYSFIVMNEDGSRQYWNLGRLDPVAMPFGIVADIVDALSQADPDDDLPQQATDAMAGALLGIVKQMGQKAYLQGANSLVQAIAEPDRNAGKVAGQLAANLVPGSSALRFLNTDDTLKEARGLTDRLLAAMPGLSDKVPARRDMFGDPITIHKGFWRDGDKTFVDAEIRRMAQEHGLKLGPPSPTIDGVDLRDITMTDGRNAYEAYQLLAAQPAPGARPVKEVVALVMKTAAYQRAPDGESDTRGTKAWMLLGSMAKYRAAALRQIKADPEVREALGQKAEAVRTHYQEQGRRDHQAQQMRQLGEAFGVDLSTSR